MMGKIRRVWDRFFSKASIKYIDFVYKSSKVVKTGSYARLHKDHDEKFVLGFWHGDSY
jgi:lysophospholipid acyltransferase (LPLAT)-like uncharacterized protein